MKKSAYKNIQLNTTQSRVFEFMLENGSITSLEAVKKLGETRLSARIFELKEKGINISCEFIDVKNRFNERRHVKRYYIG